MKNAWEEIYKRGEFLGGEVHPEMDEVAGFLKKKGTRRILDLGCGSGRHTVYLASVGFDVYGLDLSPAGLMHTISVLGEQGLSAHLTLHDMVVLPYDDGYFDAVISIQVIHHNKLKDIQRTVKEIDRVLKEGGFVWITVPASRNEPSKTQEEIEPGTFIPLDGPEQGLLHHYFKREEMALLFPGFSVIHLDMDQVNHLSLLAEKPLH